MSGNGGSSGPTSSTTQTSNIPDWLRPQVETALGAATQQIFTTQPGAGGTQTITGFRPYVPYSTNPADYVAGFSPMQNQAFQSAANLQTPGQFGYGSDLAAQAGAGALGTTGAAMGYGGMGAGYGQTGADIGTTQGLGYGQMGVGYGAQGAEYGAQGAQYGQLGAGTAAGALDYGSQGVAAGQRGEQIGSMALGYGQTAGDIGGQARGMAGTGFGMGKAYEQMATDPSKIQAYMNPYVAASMDPQLKLMNQQLAQQQAKNQAQAAASGAFGGSRQAVMQGLTQQNSDLAKQQLIAQGYNTAFNQAQQAQQFGANLGLQGYQAGIGALQTGIQGQQAAMQGVQGALAGTAQRMQGAGLGLQGIQGAQAAYGLGMQGAGLGIQGAQAGMQGAGLGLQGVNAALAGTAQGMQGAQVGLQGVQGAQAGYGLANQAAGQMGQLGTQQLGAEQGIIGLQSQLGGQQQSAQQQAINQAISDYAMAQQYPQQQLAFYNSLLRGYATPTTTQTSYQAAPNPVSQMAGLGLTGAAAYGMMKRKGGAIKEGDGIDDLGVYHAMKGSE